MCENDESVQVFSRPKERGAFRVSGNMVRTRTKKTKKEITPNVALREKHEEEKAENAQ